MDDIAIITAAYLHTELMITSRLSTEETLIANTEAEFYLFCLCTYVFRPSLVYCLFPIPCAAKTDSDGR